MPSALKFLYESLPSATKRCVFLGSPGLSFRFNGRMWDISRSATESAVRLEEVPSCFPFDIFTTVC